MLGTQTPSTPATTAPPEIKPGPKTISLTKPLTKPTPPTPSGVAKTDAFAAAKKPVRMARQPKTLADTDAQYVKILAYGHTGSGKTFIIASLLRLGLNVLAISTDFGGEGFDSVRNELKRTGEAALLNNCYYFELTNYDDVEDFVENPEGFWPDIFDHDIDVAVWDGASAFQQVHLDDKVMSFEADKNSGDARKAGMFAEMKDWGAIKRGTTHTFNKFLAIHDTKHNKKWHKIVLAHEGKLKEDKLTGDSKISPLMQGAGAALIEPAFDVIFRCRQKMTNEDGKRSIKYFYQMLGSDDKVLAKTRGLKFEPVEPADFKALWLSIMSQKGLPLKATA